MGLLLHKRFQIDFNNPILALDAVAWKWEVPSYSNHRGRAKVNTQWNLYCMLHNIEKLSKTSLGRQRTQ
jgi:hypothetical protein